MRIEAHISKALKEVWEWKDACYRDVAHLPRREALLKLIDDADLCVAEMNLRLPPISERRAGLVAEARTKYGKNQD